MAATHETIADIIAEMRKYATDYYGRTIENGGEKGNPGMFYCDMAQFAKVNADRLEAAHKRERGDCAKMREALVQVQKKINYLIGNLTVPNSLVANRMEINGIINAALAAPARNCDVGVPEERIQRWSKFCKARSKKLPPIHGFEWEDYPYESEVKEGGNNGNE